MAEQNEQIGTLCRITKAASLQEVTDLTYHLLGNPIFVADMAHTILAYTKCVEVPDDDWQRWIVNAQLERNLIAQNRQVEAAHSASTENRMPVLVQDDALAFPRLVKTLVLNGQPVGVVVLTAYFQPFTPADAELLEIVSNYVTPKLREEQFNLSADTHALTNYFLQLIEGADYSRQQVQKRLRVLNWKAQPNCYVLVLQLPELDPIEGRRDLRPILDSLNDIPYSCNFIYDKSLVLIYTCPDEILYWNPETVPLLKRLTELGLMAGISRRFDGLENLREAYLQAEESIRIGQLLERRYAFFPYDSLTIYHLLRGYPAGAIYPFCHQKIRDLAEYDKEHNSQLCITLQVYLENVKSLARTADILFVHRNTVRYRINKCMELLGSDFEDGADIFSYLTSLRILEYEKKLARSK